MVELLRHRQTKGAVTDMFYLTSPRHISTLPRAVILAASRCFPLCSQRTFSSRLFNLARLAGSFPRFTGIEPIISRKTARQKNRRASLSVLACPTRNRRRRTNKNYKLSSKARRLNKQRVTEPKENEIEHYLQAGDGDCGFGRGVDGDQRTRVRSHEAGQRQLLPPVQQRWQRLQLHQQSAVRSHGVRPTCRMFPQLLR
jgi:hypothetical protein